MVSFVFELAEAMAKEMRHEVTQQGRTFPKAYHHLQYHAGSAKKTGLSEACH